MLHKSKVIVGAGPVGLTFALSFVNQGNSIAILDSQSNFKNDSRVLALSYASFAKLKDLNGWPDDGATAIQEVHISHNGLGVSVIKASDLNLGCLGYTISYSDILEKLHKVTSNNSKIDFQFANVKRIIPGAKFATIEYSEYGEMRSLTTDLAIVAEGGKIKIDGVDYKNFDYKRIAIVATLEVENFKANTAFERFDKFGPLVLLPYNRLYKLVWSLDTERANAILKEQNLLDCLKQQSSFMKRFGELKIVGNVGSYPLSLQIAKQKLLNHVALIGNSSQTLNPISAQGMNLGIRDADLLATFIAKNGLNSSSSYDDLRRIDTNFVANFTHGLARFVEQKSNLVNHLCGAGIISLSNCKTLQNYIAKSLIFGL